MVRNAIVAAALALAAAGCAHASAGSVTAVEPSASVGDAMRALAGHWHGTIWETGAHLYQGSTPLDLTIEDDGAWSGTVGKGVATGTARLDGRGRLVLSGTATAPDGGQDPVSLALRGDATRRWAETVGRFQGREEHAQVSLRRLP